MQVGGEVHEVRAAVAVQAPPRVAHWVQHNGALLAVGARHDAHARETLLACRVRALRAGHACLEGACSAPAVGEMNCNTVLALNFEEL